MKFRINTNSLNSDNIWQAEHYEVTFGSTMAGRKYNQGTYRFGFNGQEEDQEWKGGAVVFKYRIHDPRIGRFLSVDPLSDEYPWNSTYAFAENRVIDAADLEGREIDIKVEMWERANANAKIKKTTATEIRRIIFYGGERNSKKGYVGNASFEFAARNLVKNYKELDDNAKISSTFTRSAAEIVLTINQSPDNSIKSFDWVGHGSYESLAMSKYCESCTGRKEKVNQSLYKDQAALNKTDFPTTEKATTVNDIDWSKFTSDAIIEAHGCETAKNTDYGDKSHDNGNIMVVMSKKLYAAGKTRAVTIGHTQNANPRINGDDETKHEEQDYRHGERVVFWNGNEILRTTQKGAITRETINNAIDIYEKKQKENE